MSSRAARTSLARVSRRRRAPRPVGAVRGGTAVRCSGLTDEAIADTDDYVKTDEIIINAAPRYTVAASAAQSSSAASCPGTTWTASCWYPAAAIERTVDPALLPPELGPAVS